MPSLLNYQVRLHLQFFDFTFVTVGSLNISNVREINIVDVIRLGYLIFRHLLMITYSVCVMVFDTSQVKLQWNRIDFICPLNILTSARLDIYDLLHINCSHPNAALAFHTSMFLNKKLEHKQLITCFKDWTPLQTIHNFGAVRPLYSKVQYFGLFADIYEFI